MSTENSCIVVEMLKFLDVHVKDFRQNGKIKMKTFTIPG